MKKLLMITALLMVISVDAREVYTRSRSLQQGDALDTSIAQQSRAGARARASRRTQQRFQGVTKPSIRGRSVGTRQQPAKKPAEQKITPPAGGAASVPAPTDLGINTENWEKIKNKLEKIESPLQALKEIEKIKKDYPVRTPGQEELLDVFEQRMKLEITIAKLRHLQSQQPAVTGSVEKPQQPVMPAEQTPPVGGGPSVPAAESKPVEQQAPQVTVTQPEAKPVVSITPQLQQQAPQTALGQLLEHVPSIYELGGGRDPRVKAAGSEIPVLQTPQPPIIQQQSPAAQPEVKPVVSIVPKPQQHAPQTVLGQMWQYVPSVPSLSGLFSSDPALSGSVARSQEGKHATEEGWKDLQEKLLMKASTELRPQKLVEQVEKMKQYEYFNDEQRNWLNEFQRLLKTLFVSEEVWKKIRTDLTKAVAASREQTALINRIEQIKKTYSLNNEQRAWLQEFEQKVKASKPAEAISPLNE